MSPPTAAHHSFACKLLVTQSVISCVQINHITTCKLAGRKRAPTLSTMALCSRDFLQFFWVVNFCYSLKTYLRKNWKLNFIFFACKMYLSPKICHFCENFKNWGEKKGKKVVAPTIIALCAGLIGKLGLPLKSVCYLCWLLFDVRLRFILFFGLSILLL